MTISDTEAGRIGAGGLIIAVFLAARSRSGFDASVPSGIETYSAQPDSYSKDSQASGFRLAPRYVTMAELPMFHQKSRELQQEFGTVQLADRIVERMACKSFDDKHRGFIESAAMFFLATADAQGRPDCSYKGGSPGFVRILDSETLAFPHYDGNGMFKSLGNILANPNVGLLFIDFETPRRLRVNGLASIDRADPLLKSFPGAQLLVRIQTSAIFLNCPRYVHTMTLTEHSVYAPRNGHSPPEPEWKQRPEFSDVVPVSPCQSK